MARRMSLRLATMVTAALAIGSVAAAPASAFFDATHAGESTTGTQTTNALLKTSVGTITCKVAKFAGTQTGKEVSSDIFTSETVTEHPEYGECSGFGFPVTVSTTGCNYVFSRTASAGEDIKAGKVTVECETGREIELNWVGFCKMSIPSQGPLGTVTYIDNTIEGDVSVESNISDITYGGTCGSGNEGRYTGTAIVKGGNGAIKVT